MNYNDIPKIELHVHLDGSVRIETLARLANISIEEAKKISVAPNKCLDLNDYLTRFDLPIKVMQTYDNIKLIAKELAEDLKRENVVYAEIRFAPQQHLKGSLALNQVVEAALEGLEEVNIKTKLLLSMMRNDSIEKNKEIIDLAKKYMGKVVGVDLAGAEALYPTKNFKELFEYANLLEVPFTIHAGEADGINSIISALNFGAKRIGHGIRCIEDEEVLKRLKEENVLLEICPTSNIQTNIVEDYCSHPFYELYKKGINVSINTDNRTVSNVSLTDEYCNLSNAFNLTLEDFININKNSLDYTFMTNEEKEEIKTILINKNKI